MDKSEPSRSSDRHLVSPPPFTNLFATPDGPDELVLSGSSINLTDQPLAEFPDHDDGVNVEQTCETKHSLLPAPVQMIGEEGAFYRLNVESVGVNDPFTLISIIGAQCSGKSYLLNHIFGTNFEVMNAVKGRRQTTKGVWLSKSTIPNFLVLDVEGSDGKEKQDQLSSERKIALFLLQLSNLIIVNMRLQDINRQLGGSSTLLPAIFQEKPKVNSARTNILVVIRGYDNETPVELLQSDVLENMKKLWKSSVPHESPMFEQCIEPFVVALPDKSVEEDFKREVLDLREKLIKGCFTTIREDFASKANSIWQSIRQNKQFKLPAHDHMVATSTINCERTIQSILDNLESFEGYASLVASTSSNEFWEAYTCLSNGTSTNFDKETEMCDITVRNKKHQELKQTILERVDPIHRNILTRQNQEMQEKYKELIREEFWKAEDHMSIVDDSVKRCMEDLEQTCIYMASIDKDAYDQFLDSFQSALLDFANNEAELIQRKRETTKLELVRDEREKTASILLRESEALEQEVIRNKEKLSKDKEMARGRLEQERKGELARNQRVREESQRESENLTRKLENLDREEEAIKKDLREGRFHQANTIVRTMFSLAGGFAASFLGVPHRVPYRGPRATWDTRSPGHSLQTATQTQRRQCSYQEQPQPMVTDVTEEWAGGFSNYASGDEDQMEDQ